MTGAGAIGLVFRRKIRAGPLRLHERSSPSASCVRVRGRTVAPLFRRVPAGSNNDGRCLDSACLSTATTTDSFTTPIQKRRNDSLNQRNQPTSMEAAAFCSALAVAFRAAASRRSSPRTSPERAAASCSAAFRASRSCRRRRRRRRRANEEGKHVYMTGNKQSAYDKVSFVGRRCVIFHRPKQGSANHLSPMYVANAADARPILESSADAPPHRVAILW